MKPKLLDLFCAAGGAAMGYHNAGFEVIGVDILPQPRYPFAFIQGDALAWLEDLKHIEGIVAIHASPPCQAYSVAAKSRRNAGHEYPDLVAPTREALQKTGLPWIMENVPGAPLRADFVLCGSQFGLKIVRHRWFEVSWGPVCVLTPACSHDAASMSIVGHGTPTWVKQKRIRLGMHPTIVQDEKREIMQMPWAARHDMALAVPPAYTEYLGKHLLEQVEIAA